MATGTPARIPSLDGLRAISISAVLLGHMSGTRNFPVSLNQLVHNPAVDVANLGVRVFFVISGFLITGLLIKEEHASGTISLKRFYIRRTLRIFPAYFAFLAVVALLDARHVIAVPGSDFVHALTYTMNYAPDRTWYVGHLWSLAVEEQFYLLWPFVFLITGTRHAWRVALAVVCLVPFIRLTESMMWPETRELIGTSFETTADALAVGCLLALSREWLFARAWYRTAMTSRWIAPAMLVAGLALSVRYRPAILLGQTIVNVAIAIGIDRCVRLPGGAFGRLLNLRAMVFAGTLSYSLYLWQQCFLNRSSTATLAAFPLNILGAIAAALLCYYLVEKPALRLRAREARPLATLRSNAE